MSPERATSQKKRTPAPDGDHRKRRRNRTTQSCLNCHTSKRMCDRKRPCGRCTQLGLTGLCVFEVDDPSHRGESQDESTRLRSRVAELEGVIREMKNKPHPRWAVSGVQPSEEFEKTHPRTPHIHGGDDAVASDDRLNACSPRQRGNSFSDNSVSSKSSSVPPLSINFSPSALPQSSPTVTGSQEFPPYTPYFNHVSSPLSTPSPATVTPSGDLAQLDVAIAGNDEDISQDLDLASILSSYPGLMGCENEAFPQLGRSIRPENGLHNSLNEPRHSSSRLSDGHCGCLSESASYNILLELSLRLRKASDILSRSSNHRMGSRCLLNQRIAELDTFATTILGNTVNPMDDLSQPLSPRARPILSNLPQSVLPAVHGRNQCKMHQSAPTVSSQSLHVLRSWDMIPSVSDFPSNCDDSFMSWDPPRRSL